MAPKTTIIYDGDCPMCQRACEWIRSHSCPDTFDYLPCQSDERKQAFPLIETLDCMQSIHVVLPSGEVHAGADAFPPILQRLNRYQKLIYLFKIPGSGFFAPIIYSIIARNRLAISALFIKKSPDESCSIDKGCE